VRFARKRAPDEWLCVRRGHEGAYVRVKLASPRPRLLCGVAHTE
jgi:hypothetical protein